MIAGEGELPDEASLEGGDFEAHSKKTKCQEVDPSRRGGLKTEVTLGGLRNGRKIRTARTGEGDGDKSERRRVGVEGLRQGCGQVQWQV